MARQYLTDKQMPWHYWYWALRHANCISNIFPRHCNDIIATSNELVFGIKPDYCQLFGLFSTAYLSHTKYNTHPRSSSDPHTLQGIAVGYSDCANGMEIYNPSTKQLYTTTVFCLDEQNETRNHFNLQYDGAMFFYSAKTTQATTEQFPPGTKINYKKPDSTTIQGYVIAVPDTKFGNTTANYTLRLEDGTIKSIPATLLPTLTHNQDDSIPSTPFPPWVAPTKQCTMKYNNSQMTGVFHQFLDDTWEFHSTNRSRVVNISIHYRTYKKPFIH